MKTKTYRNLGLNNETYELLKELKSELKLKSLNDVIVYLLKNVE